MIGSHPLVLPEAAVAWLRQLHAAPRPAGADPVGTACLLGLLAHRTPAWTEGYVGLLDRLIAPRIERVPGGDDNGALDRLGPLLVLLGVRAMISPDDRWSRAGADGGADGGAWTQGSLAAHGGERWPHDPVVGLGLALHANRYRTSTGPDTEATPGLDLALDLALDPGPAAAALARAWNLDPLAQLVAGPLEQCGQVVDVDLPGVVLSRAEWVNDALLVRLAVAEEQPIKRTMFRLVGTEPRMWYLTGIDGTTMDSAGAAVVVRVPHLNGQLEFTAGSY